MSVLATTPPPRHNTAPNENIHRGVCRGVCVCVCVHMLKFKSVDVSLGVHQGVCVCVCVCALETSIYLLICYSLIFSIVSLIVPLL